MGIIYLTYVLVEVIEAKQTLLGRIIVFLLCLIVLGQDVLVLAQVETGQSILTAVTSKDSHRLCIPVGLATAGSIMDTLQEHLI
tara:strand:- start:110 stop:361 length:252 start_codon:yes stop_codon:yes gene_type:complete